VRDCSTKTPLSLPIPQVIFSDAQYTILPDVSAFRYHDKNVPLDEAHLKLGVRALARLHALSYAYFNKSSDNVKDFSAILKVLVDPAYQPTSNTADKDAARSMLEENFEKLIKVLESNQAGPRVLEKTITMKSMLFNIYKEARQSSSVFSVLCHGQPTLDNVIFMYDQSGIPIQAKFVNFSNCRFGSPMSDLLVFINSSGANLSREDFLFRFVYHETLVSTLKQLGVRNDIIGYDEIKTEKQKQTLYGLIESASLLLTENTGSTTAKRARVTMQPIKARRIESKILGEFVPKDASNKPAVNGTPLTTTEFEIGPRIVDLMERAAEANSTRKTEKF